MKRKTLLTTIAAAAFAAFIGVYMCVQIFTNLSQQIITADTTFVRAEDKISTSGIFLRSEQIIVSDNSGTVEFIANDGEKVSKNDDVARFFSDEQSLEQYRNAMSLQKEIDSMEYAYSHLSDGTDSVKLDTLIKMHMTKVAASLDRGDVAQAEELSSKLDAMIVQRQSAQNGMQDYDASIEALKAEKAAVLSQIAGKYEGVSAENSGYFISTLDGYESAYPIEKLHELTAADIAEVNSLQKQIPDNAIGKVVDTYEWTFVASVSDEDAKELKKRDTAKLRFSQIASDDITVTIESLKQDSAGKWVVIFKSGEMRSELLGVRSLEVDIIKNTYDGIKIPKEALRQKDGAWGVYCLVGAQVVFKEAEIIYQTESYYVAPQVSENGQLALYDKMVVRGKDIENKKVVN